MARSARIGDTAAAASTRVAEVDLARAILASGTGGLIWAGEPGMGKSSLLDSVLAHLDTAGPDTTDGPLPNTFLVRIAARALERPTREDFLAAVADQILDPTAAGAPAAADSVANLADELRRHTAGRTLVLAIDDLDLLHPSARHCAAVLHGLHGASAVLLATTTSPPCPEHVPHDVDVRTLGPVELDDALGILEAAAPGTIAPSVAARLVEDLGGNAACLRQTARLLSVHQLAGTSALPDPLPVVPAVTAVIGDRLAALSAPEREALLVASIAVTDRADVLTAASSLTSREITQGPVSDHLALAAGRFEFVDPRVRAWAHGRADIGERTRAHAALARIHRERGESDVAVWHEALSRLHGAPETVPGLLRVAQRHLARGDTEWAHAVAREAVGHATGTERAHAWELAGTAAVLSGHVHDAAQLLPLATGTGEGRTCANGLWAYVMAQTLTEQRIPDELLARAHVAASATDPDSDHGHHLRTTTSFALAIGACLTIERGESAAAWRLADQASELLGEDHCPHPFTALTRSWLAIYSQASTTISPQAAGFGPDQEGLVVMARAVALMQADECDAAARLLASVLGNVPARGGRAWFTGQETGPSPIVESYLRVVQALVELRAGDCKRAQHTIRQAMVRGPAGLVLAGLAGAISRRIDLLRSGSVSVLTNALVASSGCASTPTGRLELLIDRAIEVAAKGQWAEAATLLELAAAREARETTVGLVTPGLNTVEMWVRAGRPLQAEHALARLRSRRGRLPETTRAVVLARSELALCSEAETAAALEKVEQTSLALNSPYERGRSEMCIAWALGRAGRDDEARAHALAAQDLFEEAGALAWMPAIAADLAHLDQSEPEPTIAAADLEVSWAHDLTEREFDVARLVVDGLSNRAVASQLHLSVRTVEVHLGRVFRKLGVHSRVELTVAAHRSMSVANRAGRS